MFQTGHSVAANAAENMKDISVLPSLSFSPEYQLDDDSTDLLLSLLGQHRF